MIDQPISVTKTSIRIRTSFLTTLEERRYMIFEMRNGTIFFSHPEMATFPEDEKETTKSAQPVCVAAISHELHYILKLS
jgi:hypothetical protein